MRLLCDERGKVLLAFAIGAPLLMMSTAAAVDQGSAELHRLAAPSRQPVNPSYRTRRHNSVITASDGTQWLHERTSEDRFNVWPGQLRAASAVSV
jgi:hypothetical protein